MRPQRVAALAIAVFRLRPCVSLADTGRYCIEVVIRTSSLFLFFFGIEGHFKYPTYVILRCNESRVYPKIKVLPSGNLSQTLNL